MASNQDKLESVIGYQFLDSGLLDRALTHRSFSALNNERLEFLGDSVLGIIVSAVLYRLYTESEEGELTRMRAQVVKKRHSCTDSASAPTWKLSKAGW